MFILGIFVMGLSITGLVGLAFMQARYPDVLESLMQPIEDKSITQEDNPLADGLSHSMANGMTSSPLEEEASAAQPADAGQEGMNIEEIPVNSVSKTNVASTRQIK